MDKKIFAIALGAAIIIAILVTAPLFTSAGFLNLFSSTGISYERYNKGDNYAGGIAEQYWRGQTFTIGNTGDNEDHYITSVKLRIYRVGSPGWGSVIIYAVDSEGKPTGKSLCNVDYNFDDLREEPYPDHLGYWVEFVFASPALLSADTQYAVVLKCGGGIPYDVVAWRLDTSSSTYTGGTHILSVTGGSSWTLGTDGDFMFEEYGVPSTPPLEPPDVDITFTMTVLTIPNNCDVTLLGLETVNSGDDGIALFEDLIPETYYVTVSKNGYPTFSKTVLVNDDTLINADLTATNPFVIFIIFILIVALITSLFLFFKYRKR